LSLNWTELLYFLLLLAVSNYNSGSHIYLFWQKSPVELITIGSRRVIRVHFLEFLQHLSLYRHSLLCTYCTNSRSGVFKEKTQAKNKRQFSNPWRPKCSEGSCSGHEKWSGRCRALNATASMCDNFVWQPCACVPGGVRSKKASRTSLFLSDCGRQHARSMRFHTQELLSLEVFGLWSSFPWQSLGEEGNELSSQSVSEDRPEIDSFRTKNID